MAHSAPLNAANAARLHGCGADGARAPLLYSMQLQQAAQTYSHGASLQSAIAGAGYLAAQSAAIHLSGPTNDAQIESLLITRDCRTLQDPRMGEFGAARAGRDTWMIVAAPVLLPARGDAASVSRVILDLVNAARASGRRCGGNYFAPAGPLALDPALTRAALEHSRDMAEHDAFDHRGHDGSTPNARVERAGFGPHRIVGENIAAGAMTPHQVTDGWLASPAHCENIMDSRFTLIGIAYAENLHTASAVFWTQDFAAHR
ncbi:MAG: CAP domain-containing protein [Steroidobacteraceae bacterium]